MVIANDASPYVLELATANVADDAKVDVPRDTVSVLLDLVALAYCAVAACVAVKVTVPALTSVIKFPEASIVATLVSLLVYVIAPLLLLVGRVVIANEASPYVLELATVNVEDDNVGVARATVRVLLVLVALAYCVVAACVAVNVTFPAATRVIKFPEASMVATLVSLLVYVIAPLLLLVGRVVIANEASPYVLELATVNVDDDSVGVANDMVKVLLVTEPLVNCPATAACDALKLTSPALTIFIQLPEASMVAILVLLLLYVIAPLLLLVGRVIIANDASPYVFELGTTNGPNVGATATWPTVSVELTLLVK